MRRDEDDDSPVLRRSSVPPTICLTFPSCRSIQGLNWDLLRGASVVVVVDMVYERAEEDGDDRWSNKVGDLEMMRNIRHVIQFHPSMPCCDISDSAPVSKMK